ncbi:regulator [Streptomyces scopuliridis]|uniref:Regulator n=1 Tax=Streptomyces scopuliridis TaxID=452529 RepID=A0ACD4ZT62_9ACTN|nr:regulator [Streptomyces scopuliridis]WSC01589.1 regulator [Streptomyces scopuliridis]WSC04872.1 regulator [Streptomyces scopuliridis]
MTASFTPAGLRNAFALLSAPGLIRLITEIDDNGPIPPRRLAGTLPDLSVYQLRRAADAARAHGLVRVAPGVGLDLTASGSELADFYDATARWARRHACPTRVCDFTGRLRHTLSLLAPTLVADPAEGCLRPVGADLLSAEADADLAHPRILLVQWLNANPQVTLLFEPEPVA